MTLPADHDPPADQPLLRVVRGDATPEEIAALVAVLATHDVGRMAPGQARWVPSAWSDRSRQLRCPLFPGPGAWRGSAQPG